MARRLTYEETEPCSVPNRSTCDRIINRRILGRLSGHISNSFPSSKVARHTSEGRRCWVEGLGVFHFLAPWAAVACLPGC